MDTDQGSNMLSAIQSEVAKNQMLIEEEVQKLKRYKVCFSDHLAGKLLGRPGSLEMRRCVPCVPTWLFLQCGQSLLGRYPVKISQELLRKHLSRTGF